MAIKLYTPDKSLIRQLSGKRLITADILYHMPDYPDILQSFVWQEYDFIPKFPTLKRFLRYWQAELEGPLHSVTIASKDLICPGKVELRTLEVRL